MPTYEYQCTACSNAFEQFQSMKDKPLTKCPTCGKNKLERLIGTGAAIIFKGSGFYQTDYRSEAYKKSADADTKSATVATETKSDSKPDSKPDTKADAPKPTDPTPAAKSQAEPTERPREKIKPKGTKPTKAAKPKR